MSRCRSGASFSSSKGNFRNHLGQGLEDLIFRVRIARLSQNRIRAINRVSAWSFPQIGISSVVFQWLAHWLAGGGRNQIQKRREAGAGGFSNRLLPGWWVLE